jgi:hypothetical protein
MFLYTFSNYKNGFLPNKIVMIRNNGEIKEVNEESHEGEKD